MHDRIRVGIIGLGRSGYGIHLRTIRESVADAFDVVAVTDPMAARRDEVAAELGCRAHAGVDELVADPAVELVVVASPNRLHVAHSLAALAAGKAVVCEKPVGFRADDVDRLIAAAEHAGRPFCPFQQRRFMQDLTQVRAVVDSGVLGAVFHVRICWQGFKRRWDWQTSRATGGGCVNNNGPHPIDHALVLLGCDEPEVWAHTGRHLCAGDAEDHLKLVLRDPASGRVVEVELSDAVAIPQPVWSVWGDRGALSGSREHLEWRWCELDGIPDLDLEPTADRSYNRDHIEWQEASWDADPDFAWDEPFYRALIDTLRHGAPPPVPPQEVRRVMAVVDRIHALCDHRLPTVPTLTTV